VNHVKEELLPEVDFAQFDREEEPEKEKEKAESGIDSELKWE
jgi:hypothetical protein